MTRMVTNPKDAERLKEILKLAEKLDWIRQPSPTIPASYPLMQLSEVEKCMLAMADDFELARMRKWVGEKEKQPLRK